MLNEKTILIIRVITWGLIVFMLSSALMGCANMPTAYGQIIEVTGGLYKGERGRLIGDCSGFENYKVDLYTKHGIICVRSWNMQKLN